ncbi:MAG: potassium channel family protein [Actinomycetota bacterium]|nr:potassium channel family protein [Actinomycetota bacterium]
MPARLEAFSDGVFAVAITLLALDLAVDGPGHGSLANQLRQQWPSFVAYVVSFFIIGITWVNHHELFNAFAKVDRALLFLNLVLLLFIVAIPFATTTMATYLTSGGADAHLAAALYGAVLEGMGLSYGAIFAWSLRGTNRREPLPPAAARAATLRFGLGSIVYLVAIGLAFISAPASLALIAAVAVYYAFEQTATPGSADDI